jgi:hypothetical protein
LRDHSSAENALITAGDDLINIRNFLRPGATTYGAAEVIAELLDAGTPSLSLAGDVPDGVGAVVACE